MDSDDIPPPPPQQHQAAPSKLPLPKSGSRLPVMRKASGTVIHNPQLGSLRPQLSRERLPDQPGSPRSIPTLSKRSSCSRLPGPPDQGGEQSNRNFTDATASSAAKVQPRKIPSNASLNGSSGSGSTTPTLKGRPSLSSLQVGSQSATTINISLARKASGSLIGSPMQSPQLQAPRIATPKGRRTSDINGAAAPPMNRRSSNTQLRQPSITVSKRNSMSQLTKNMSQIGAPADVSPSPAMRRQPSTGLPVTTPTPPRTPTATRSIRPPQTVSRIASRGGPKLSAGVHDSPGKSGHKLASQSLRDTIRQARAAKQRGPSLSNGEGNGLAGFDFGTADPFNQAILGEGGSAKVLKQRIKSARVEGRLNISNLQLKGIPAEVYKMYETTEDDLTPTDDGPKWYESVDLAKLIGADNELAEIGDGLAEQFGGLSVIDLHNNLLTTLPANFARLTQLTALNMAGNKLDNGALGVIFQITALKDLKLSKNNLEGELDTSLSGLAALETLELQDNKLTSLPPSLGECSRLRVLNVARNALAVLPIEDLSKCALTELDVSQNKLSDTFIPASLERWDSLQSLNLNSNHITSFAESAVALPALNQLFLSNNQLAEFPILKGWSELLVLLVDQNRITTLPEDLYGLRRLRTLDFSGNSIKTIDARLGGMECLEVISFAGNPLLDRKLAGMCTPDLKRTLRARLAPPEIVIAEAEDDESDMVSPVATGGSPPKALEVGRGGVLDLSNKGLSDLSEELVDSILGSPYTLLLSQNTFTGIPTNLDLFASLSVLDLASNRFSPDYLSQRLTLRSLESLKLHNTGITSLQVLFTNLEAPRLQTLDISANRVESIVGLRQAFPTLLNLHAADNQIAEIPIESIDGIRCLDLSGNAINSLPPQLALCEGLRELRVQGNLFRVPRWQVLEKGTDSVLAWLRDRLPVEGGGGGDGGDGD